MLFTSLDLPVLFAFVVAAIGLLGSPGPAIAALLAVGKVHGFGPGLRFYGGLQVGLATAAALSAAGFVGIVTTFPVLRVAMTIIACGYLLYLAYKIATAPVGNDETGAQATPSGGFGFAGAVLGITNPKAYVAFAALMAPVTIIAANSAADAVVKWILVVAVMIVVDFAWLLAGLILGRTNLPSRVERLINWSLATLVVVAGAALL